MTGENHLTEFATCYKGGNNLAKEAVDAFSKIRHGHVIAGAKEASAVFAQFPDALKDCKNMQDDIAAVQQWAKMFKDPMHLAHLVTKHAIVHEAEIAKDVKIEAADWAAGNYFKSGIVSADMVTILMGPLDKSYFETKALSSAKLMTQVSATVDCSSDADQAAWASVSPNFGTDVSACAGLSTPYKCTSIFKMNGPCVASCMQKTQSFSASCSAAFGDLAVCGFKNCKSACITGDPNAPSCV
jgi:hypothetical protein